MDIPISPFYFRKMGIKNPQIKGIVRKKDKRGYNLCYDDVSGKRVSCGDPKPKAGDNKPSDTKPKDKQPVEKKPEDKKPITPPKVDNKPKPETKPKPPKADKPKKEKITVDRMKSEIENLKKGGSTPEKIDALVSLMTNMTVKDLKTLVKDIKANTAGKVKAEIVKRLKDRIAQIVQPEEKPPEPKPEEKPVEPETKPVEVETKPKEKEPEEKPADQPKPKITLNLKQDNPDHPVAKSIRDSQKAVEVFEKVLTKQREFLASDDGKELLRLEKADANSDRLYEVYKKIKAEYGENASQTKQAFNDWSDSFKDMNGDKLKELRTTYKSKQRQDFVEAMAPKNPPNIGRKNFEGMYAWDNVNMREDKTKWRIEPFEATPQEDKVINKGTEFIRSITEGGGIDRVISYQRSLDGRASFGEYKKEVEVDEPSDNRFLRLIGLGKKTRKEVTYDPRISLGSTAKVDNPYFEESAISTQVHELGHFLEEFKPGVKDKVHAFLSYRLADEPLVDIGTMPGGEQMKGEMGRKDKFDQYFDTIGAFYVGKEYKDEKGDLFGTEILSMGIQALYDNPIKFMEKDPEYAAFVIDCLRS